MRGFTSTPQAVLTQRVLRSQNKPNSNLDTLVAEIRACRVCAHALPHAPNPVVWVHPDARILIAGQAPGRLVHETGIPWNDRSGDRLRDWMGLDRAVFYARENIAVAAMGFCFPGTVKGADLPPRKECAPLWRPRLLPLMKDVRLTLLVGGYAHKYHLGKQAKASLSETVAAWRDYPSNVLPLPHPSWRNTGWLKRNPWFEAELVPVLRRRVRAALG
jgi:uracil-DNA glycosylase